MQTCIMPGCMCAKYPTMAGCICRLRQRHVFSPPQGMDASGEPLLQFKFRVQFYVETHLLLRYVYPHFCCLHHLLPSASLPRLTLIALSTASPIVITTCTLLIVLFCRFHHLFSPLCPHPPALIVLASRSCAPHHSTSPQVSSPLKRVPTTCCFVLV